MAISPKSSTAEGGFPAIGTDVNGRFVFDALPPGDWVFAAKPRNPQLAGLSTSELIRVSADATSDSNRAHPAVGDSGRTSGLRCWDYASVAIIVTAIRDDGTADAPFGSSCPDDSSRLICPLPFRPVPPGRYSVSASAVGVRKHTAGKSWKCRLKEPHAKLSCDWPRTHRPASVHRRC